MADNNTYTSKQNIKKYTTQEKFDAIDKTGVPVGTEYNIVGAIEKSDLSEDLQAEIDGKQDTLTIDQTYNATSENPQSGTAVAEAVSTKQDTLTAQTNATVKVLHAEQGITDNGGYILIQKRNGTGNRARITFANYPGTVLYDLGVEVNTKASSQTVNLPDASGTIALREGLKTVFGQSLVGSGNLTLYRHTIKLTGNSDTGIAYGLISILSPNSVNVNSLDALKTILGDTFEYPCTGYSPSLATGFRYQFLAITESVIKAINIEETTTGGDVYDIPLAGTIFTDTVTEFVVATE